MYAIPENELYKKYAESAKGHDYGEIFSDENILELAGAAKLEEPIIEVIKEFLVFVARNREVGEFIRLLWYVAYESGERLTGADYARLPLMGEVEAVHPGMCELIVAIAAEVSFKRYVDSHGLGEFVDPNAYKVKIHKWSNENYIKNGSYGLVDWRNFRHEYASGDILVIGRLVFQKKSTTVDYFEVYRRGDEYVKIALPKHCYDEEGFMTVGGVYRPEYRVEGRMLYGETFDENGLLKRGVIRVDLDEYEKFLGVETPTLGVHIPGADVMGPLTPEAVKRSIEMAKTATKLEGVFSPKTFTCSSWLLDTQLRRCLKPTSNILAFQSLFDIAEHYPNTYSLYGHIFGVPECPVEQLVPRNSFETKLLEMIKSGRPLRSGFGYFMGDF